MTTESLQARIDALNPDTADWSDPATYAALGIGEDDDTGGQGQQDQGDIAQAAAAATAPAPAAATPAAPPSTNSSQAPAAAPASSDSDRVDGVATADGKRVIPYAVLQQTRHEARSAREEVGRLQKELEAAQQQLAASGNQDLAARASSAPETLTAEELAELEQDYPSLSKLVKVVMSTQEKLQAAATQAPAPAAAAPAPAGRPESDEEQFDAAIAASPLISKWMTEGGPEWERAKAIDGLLQKDPNSAGLTYEQRFAKVQRMVAAEFDIPLPSAAPTPAAPAASPAAPAAPAVPAAKAAPLPSLSDLGGTPPQSSEDAINGKTAADLLAATQNMSEQELMRMAGVSY